MARAAFLLICILSLSGCGAMALTVVGANVATLVHADKTIPDIVLSEQRGQNCSLLHASRDQPYCQSAPPDPTEVLAELANNRYCYRTLGRIDCYDRPDFLASGLTRVNFANGFLPASRTPGTLAQRPGDGHPMAGIPARAAPATMPETTAMSPKVSNPAVKDGSKDTPSQMEKMGGEQAFPPKDAAAMAPPTATPASVETGRTGTPVAQIPPLAAIPGQGTY